MGYVAFSELGGGDVARRPSIAVEAPARLTALEWSVVAIAWSDRLSSLRRPGRLARALGGVFGGHNPRLADPALEALRRMAVLTWRRGYTVPPHEVSAFRAAGYSAEQYELLVDGIAAARRRDPPRHA
ncbi:hypothetical protein [Sphingomonas bacterium]|uniref:hypothetical protein n=1 Tax=Sphingomonas bacterium TaxID=1895847 RepID=UPI0015773756|nr:hypothetical protein [Sphingomonas bacterium]